MTFDQLASLPSVASGLIPDGYNGHMAEITWRFDANSGKTMAQHSMGFYNTHLPDASDIAESEWLLRNHPNCREWIVRNPS